MTEQRRIFAVRSAKGVVVGAVAAVVCFWFWSALDEWATDTEIGPNSNFGSGFVEGVTANLAGIVVIPVLLWAGMRLARERNNYLLVVGCGMLWPFIGGMLIDENHGVTATVLLLVLFPVLGGVLSLLGARKA